MTDDYKKALQKCNAPCKVVLTIRKMKTVLPSLKTKTENALKSGVVYQITCPQCKLCYVGQTSRHLLTRFKEHMRKATPVGSHLQQCNANVSVEDVKILASTSRNMYHLMTLEALWIDQIKPELNTKDEFRSRAL